MNKMYTPNLSLRDKVALVTGGRRGVGKAVALTVAMAGANIALCDNIVDTGELETTAIEIEKLGRRSLVVQTDISQKTEVDSMMQKVVRELGAIDILMNNAAI